MLPRPGGARIAENHRLSFGQSGYSIGNELMWRPVAAANDISRTGARKTNLAMVLFVTRKVRLAKGVCDQFCTGLATGVWIATAKRILFAITPDPAAVLVDLVRCDIHHRAFALIQAPHAV